MSQQIKFYDKSKLDLSNGVASITITDSVATNNGQDYVDFMRNRNNVSAWMTTGSTDAALTTIDVELVDEREITTVILTTFNFKAYTIQYWDGGAYVDFSTPVNETANVLTSIEHSFDQISTSKIRIIVSGTMIADADKRITQLIITKNLLTGQLDGWPVIKRPRHNTNKKVSIMLSGKVNVVESVGGFSCDLSVKNWNSDSDLSLVEEIYFGKRGVLMWLSGGDEAQFSHNRAGYRGEDIYLVRAVNDYTPEWSSGLYTTGMKINMKLKEAIE